MQRLLVLRSQAAPVGHALIVIVGDEVEQVLLEVGTGAGEAVDLVLSDHFGEAQADLRRGHGPGEGDEHLAVLVGEEGSPSIGRGDEAGGVEVAVVVPGKCGDGTEAGGVQGGTGGGGGDGGHVGAGSSRLVA
jgi:hypothetical protein